MTHRNLRPLASCLVAVCLIGSAHTCEAAIIDSGTFLTIDDAGNPSDGLQYLNMSFSVGLTEAAAIANGVSGGFANTRVATPTEFNDLIAAAGITYNGMRTAADGFATGTSVVISSNENYDGRVLAGQLGATNTLIWTDPDGDTSSASTRDFLQLATSLVGIGQTESLPGDANIGWLLVNESASAVPEPSSALLLGFASMIGIATYRRRRV